MRLQPATKRLLAVLAICLAASLPYVSSADNYFVNDDFGVVQLLSQKPPLYFPRWFVTSWMDDIWGATQDEIRPFPAVTYQLAAIWGATSTLANHVTNIAFHAANALLVLAIARAVVGVSFIASTYAALVFAILPLHAESVAWITGRVDTIPALFFLGSFLAYAHWRRGGAKSTRLYLCSIVLFFCALFSKQNTIVMVATLFLYDLVAERRPIRASWSWLAPYVPFAVVDGRLSAPALRVVWRGRARRATDRRWTGRLSNLRGKALPADVLRRRGRPVPRRLHRRAAPDCRRLVPHAFLRRREPAPRTGAWFCTSARAGGFSAWPLSWSWAMNRPGTCISPRWDGRLSSVWCFTPSGTSAMRRSATQRWSRVRACSSSTRSDCRRR